MIALIAFLGGGIPNKNTLDEIGIKFASIRSMNMKKSETTKHFGCEKVRCMESKKGLCEKLNGTLKIKMPRG